MIGTRLVEELVQSAALSHVVKDYERVSLLLLASPESGKTTICASAKCEHVQPVNVLSGRSVLAVVQRNPKIEFLLFNDMGAVRALSTPAVNLLIVMLNQLVLGERGLVGFAGEFSQGVNRPVGVFGCLPFHSFCHHKARWRELGFVSRMVPFAYGYPEDLVVQIKDAVDEGQQKKAARPSRRMPKRFGTRSVKVEVSKKFTKVVRHLADMKAEQLGQLGIRLLQNYHSLVRAHALLFGRRHVVEDDVVFLREVDKYVSVVACKPLEPTYGVLRSGE